MPDDEEKIPVKINGPQNQASSDQPKPSLGPVAGEASPSQLPSPEVVVPKVKPKRHPIEIIIILIIIAALAAVGYFGWRHYHHKTLNAATTASSKTSAQAPKSTNLTTQPGLKLNASKNYGNKYADGVLPVGDGKYTTSGPKTGYVYACSDYAKNLASSSGGAMTRGPWFMDGGKEYDVNKKLHVEGSVTWHGSMTISVNGNTRTIVSNDLPINDPTGIFPIETTDPAYAYDHNPNSIEAQSFTYAIAANPAYNSTPNCESGQVGVMLTGVALFNAMDAGGRDAGAWEVQDGCDGHPQSDGIYHYHTLSSCIKNISVSTVIGYALDGFPITGPQVGPNNMLTTADLDECHGIVSPISFNGKTVDMYHYVMTEDFPYSISCFRGKPITPPGQGNGQSPGQNQAPKQTPGHPPAPPHA